VPQTSVPHPCEFFLPQGWGTTAAGYSISGFGLVLPLALPAHKQEFTPDPCPESRANARSKHTAR